MAAEQKYSSGKFRLVVIYKDVEGLSRNNFSPSSNLTLKFVEARIWRTILESLPNAKVLFIEDPLHPATDSFPTKENDPISKYFIGDSPYIT